jgi:putative membrane protein
MGGAPVAFIHAATVAGLAEVKMDDFMEQKATSRAVKEFAQRIVRDHRIANDRPLRLGKG